MNKQAASATDSRHGALTAIWDILAHSDDPVSDRRHAGKPNVSNPDRRILARLVNGEHARITNSLADKIIKQGISSQAIGPLGDLLGLGKGLVAEYLDLDRGTANRRASKDLPLPTHAAEGVLRFLELDQMACDTFESNAESSDWLRRPHPMLDGETPLEAAKTSFGAQRVKDILLAIKYGGVL